MIQAIVLKLRDMFGDRAADNFAGLALFFAFIGAGISCVTRATPEADRAAANRRLNDDFLRKLLLKPRRIPGRID